MKNRVYPALCAAAVMGALIAGCGMEWSANRRVLHRPPGYARTMGLALPAQGDTGVELWVIERTTPTRKILRRPDEREGLCARHEDALVPLPLKHTDVKAQISLFIGSVRVTQQYHNPYDGKIEAVYVFPLPQDSAVSEFVMTIGDRHIRGIIREREEARKIYLEARRLGHVASLLTQERPNIFTQSVANIEPGKQIDIEITYFHALAYADGEYEFRFPMVVGPRFNPDGTTETTTVEYLRPDEISAHDIDLEVAVDAGVPIESLESPSHEIVVERRGPARAVVRLNPHDRIPNKDFVLRYRVAGKRLKAGLATYRDESGGYFALMLQPPVDLDEIESPAREMIFVVDCSGSMSGEPLATVKHAMERCLKRLGPKDTFQIVRFSNTATRMAERPIPATSANVRKGLQFVRRLKDGGGTYLLKGLRAALTSPADPERYRIVSLMTDGYISNDREVIGEVQRLLGDARLFTFGIGMAPNGYLIQRAAKVGRGASVAIGTDESSRGLVDQFYRRIENPALTDIRIDWGAMKVTDVHPKPIPDLFVGRPVILTGRFTGTGTATVRVTGKIAGIPHEQAIAINLDQPDLQHKALAAVWARSEIATLYDAMTVVDDRQELVDAITELALSYGLMSEFTAFLAVDSAYRTKGESGTTVDVPVPVPKGVKYKTTVKEPKNP